MNDEKNIDTILSLSKEELEKLVSDLSLSDIENLYEVIKEVSSND
jgi:ADP-dependent phosphofructokinase/glucokinase